MRAIQTMMHEHRLIERVLAALEAYVEQVKRGDALDTRELGRFVRFIREFADTAHHGKEEDILFTAMADAGFPTQAGPIAVMLAEHDEGRHYVATMAEVAERPGPVDPITTKKVIFAARSFIEMLRQHIAKEDQILYPMAASHLPPDVVADVDARCDQFEQKQSAAGVTARLHALGDSLVERHILAQGGRPSAT